MIISHQHKYVFIEFPQTGCSAIATELMANYSGERVLYKHAQYQDFKKKFKQTGREYFAFSTIRNPLDLVVSKYFKYKHNHKGYVDKKVVHGKARRLVMPGVEKGRRDDILANDLSFEEFFLKYYKWPYSSWSIMDHKNLNFVLRFEQLSQDFEKVIAAIGIPLVRPLPLFNATEGKAKDFYQYYQSPEVRSRAVSVFKPYMDEWGYSFPADWGVAASEKGSHRTYQFINYFRKFYWRHLR